MTAKELERLWKSIDMKKFWQKVVDRIRKNYDRR